MAMPTLRHLRLFLAACDTGSVSAAARALAVTQPAASQQLRELERLLGAKLFERAGGRVIPTAAGEGLLAPARRAQAAAEDAVAAVAAYRSGTSGRVRLGTGATVCIHLLPPALAALKQRLPGLEITITTGNTAEMLRRVETGDLDLALVTLPGTLARGLAATRLLTDPLLAVLPEALVPAGTALRPAQLGRLPLILYEPGGATRAIVDAWFRRAGVVVKPAMQLGSVEAIKTLVESGLGASILPALALRDGLTGAVTRPLRPALARGLALVLRREKVMDRLTRTVVVELEKLGA